MIPVFYIGSGSGEIHLKMSKEHSITIKVGINGPDRQYSPRLSDFNGKASRVTINGVNINSPEIMGRRITYNLISDLYRLSTGEPLKYNSIVSARTNIEKVQELIALMTPDLHIEFKLPENIKPEVEYTIDEQIFNFWVNKNV